MAKNVLNLGSGKVETPPNETGIFVNVDSSYGVFDSLEDVLKAHRKFMLISTCCPFFVREDIFTFLESYPLKFDEIIANRIFEHMFFDDGSIGRLLFLCSQITTESATMKITVPNFESLVEYYNRCSENLQYKDLLLLNTELCNSRSDPHGSIWTPSLAKKYFENEGGPWVIQKIENIETDSRPIYMSIYAKKQGRRQQW